MQKIKAAEWNFTNPLYESIGGSGTNDYQAVTVAEFVQPILNAVYGVAFILLLINLVILGLRVTTRGQKGLEEAKKGLKYTLIGLLVVVFAFAITNLLASLFVVK